jgi:hypothetical protein
MRKWISQLAAVVGGVGFAILGVALIGKLTREQIRSENRDAVAFADIECAAPPGQNREDFLGEVRYLADLPGEIHLSDEGLAARLADGFALHPWVERVERVEVRPPRDLSVSLTFRRPALVVQWRRPAQSPECETRRIVDGNGVLLPVHAPLDDLPVLQFDDARRPAVPAGRPWGARVVEAAARTAAFLREHQGKLRLTRWEASGDQLLLHTAAGSRVIWGNAPGEESADEAAAAVKLQRLLDYCAKEGDLDHPSGRSDIDIRFGESVR